ncbi:hypothetical protein PoB_007144700 [Plakobranchus ocellatus]|uniref:Uncharacterized protein n=1 Tax=Plakobranchus ocellatus TaxID=259542 RepID=A0AAV4DKY9_9GAST|nr:hypothetical protein PoB_007144700 [Plakobranchus ocellatus]
MEVSDLYLHPERSVLRGVQCQCKGDRGFRSLHPEGSDLRGVHCQCKGTQDFSCLVRRRKRRLRARDSINCGRKRPSLAKPHSPSTTTRPLQAFKPSSNRGVYNWLGLNPRQKGSCRLQDGRARHTVTNASISG